MNKLMELLAQHPEEKEEFDTIIEVLNIGSTEQIKMWMKHAERLEDMIEEKIDRVEMLEYIDWFNHWTEMMHMDGTLPENVTWVDTVK